MEALRSGWLLHVVGSCSVSGEVRIGTGGFGLNTVGARSYEWKLAKRCEALQMSRLWGRSVREFWNSGTAQMLR